LIRGLPSTHRGKDLSFAMGRMAAVACNLEEGCHA
jgi:hypothetical protein